MTQNPKLEPDKDALETWEQMPKNQPSRQALPPVSGGLPNWLIGLIGLAVLIVILGLLQS